jgi:hypothetical protein
MAQAPQSPGGNDNFIRQIVSDPKNVPDVMLLTGYLGASSEEGHDRLYLSPDLTNYVEIPRDAILHQAPLPKEQDAHGGVTLWVKKDAALQYKMAPAAQALANYFAGAIQAGAQAAGRQPPHTVAATCHAAATCGVHISCANLCGPTLVTPCLNTHANTCFCPVTLNCRTQVPAACEGTAGACTYIGCGASLACTQGLLCAQQAAFAGQQQGGAAAGGFPAAAVRPAQVQQSIGGCGQSIGAACTAGDCSYLVACQSQAGTCIPAQTCMPNVCTVDTVWCPTAFAICPPTPANPCVSAGATCAPCTHNVACQIVPSLHVTCAPCVTHIPVQCSIVCPTRLEFSCNIACQLTRAVYCEVASGVACPQVSLACPQASLACGGLPGQQGFGKEAMQALYFAYRTRMYTNCNACWMM